MRVIISIYRGFASQYLKPKWQKFERNLPGGDSRRAPAVSFRTPGYFPPSVWSVQRPDNEGLARKLFPQSPFINEERHVSTGTVHIAGKPVDDNFKYTTFQNFSELPLDQKLLDNVNLLRIERMTPVQAHTIPILSMPNEEETLAAGSYDLMAAAQTGSGKTLAYLLPVLQNIMCNYPSDAMNALVDCDYQTQFPTALVLAPTRELVNQIRFEASKLVYRTQVRPVALYGGEKPFRQEYELKRGCHLVVATPGRLLDFLDQRLLNLSFCRTLIIDEADRLLDMGFEPQLRKITQSRRFSLPEGGDRQTALFSATFPPSVALLARDFLRGPRCVSLNVRNDSADDLVAPIWGRAVRRRGQEAAEDTFKQLKATVPKEIVQEVEWVDDGADMLARLVNALNRASGVSNQEPTVDVGPSTSSRMLVFCNTKKEADKVDRYLHYRGFRSVCVHGGLSQEQRNQGVQLFREGQVNILVATSVAARGLDFPRVQAVINFGLPLGLDDYVHRIGRTGRMGQLGRAITLVEAKTISPDQPHLQAVSRGVCRLIGDTASGGLPEQFKQAAGYNPAISVEDSDQDLSAQYSRARFSLPCPPQRLKSRYSPSADRRPRYRKF